MVHFHYAALARFCSAVDTLAACDKIRFAGKRTVTMVLIIRRIVNERPRLLMPRLRDLRSPAEEEPSDLRILQQFIARTGVGEPRRWAGLH